MIIVSNVMKQPYPRRRPAVNLVPCSCAAAVESKPLKKSQFTPEKSVKDVKEYRFS